ncbi:MAG: cofactor-independent phosphoglycerate mutase [Lentisphaerae bacterium]|nr:cofactor-independent phosphoglycerate mutase [Lentisphaerota bacterium]
MKRAGTIIFLGDGMADDPIPELDGRTPLEAARTPGMDRIAREGRCGTLLTLPEGYPTSSDVANMSVLGCDLAREYCGRGPLEAAGRGIPLGPDDVAFRVNLTTVADGVLTDFSGGHIPPAPAAVLIDALNEQFGADDIRFHAGVSYRNLLVLSGRRFSAEVATEKPDDNQGARIAEHLPRARTADAEPTAAFLRTLMLEAAPFLDDHPVNAALRKEGHPPANGLWPWSGGKAGAIRTLAERCGIRAAVISAVDVIVGLGRCLGMERLEVPGATGYVDTNYEGKADAALEALGAYDLIYLHVEAIDEVSHAGDLEMKMRAIEDFDHRVVQRVLDRMPDDTTVAVLPDHPVPVALRKHTRTPVPVAVRRPGEPPDRVQTFSESACPAGALGALRGPGLINLLFPR